MGTFSITFHVCLAACLYLHLAQGRAMVTTVTTTTVTTVTTLAAGSFALIAILALIALLVQKEIIGGLQGERARRVARALNIAIVPLLLVFASTVAFRVLDVLS